MKKCVKLWYCVEEKHYDYSNPEPPSPITGHFTQVQTDKQTFYSGTDRHTKGYFTQVQTDKQTFYSVIDRQTN